MTTQITISANEKGKRLDVFLSETHKEISRSQIQKLIKDGHVLLNGKNCKKDVLLKNGDNVKINIPKKEELSVKPDKSIKLDVVFKNEDFAVINKPAGLVVHPSATHKKGTLVNGALALWPKIKNVGEDPLRPGVVHRLDKDTSGVMLLAKNNETFFWLKDEFKKRHISKKYIALVLGNVKKDEGEIKAPIARVGIKQATQAKGGRTKLKNAREAETHFKVIERYKDYTLLEAMPKTGRMHQIRVHMAHIGHPIVGDTKYMPKKMAKKGQFKRHFLHAEELALTLKNGQKMTFKAPLAKDLKKVLLGLEKK